MRSAKRERFYRSEVWRQVRNVYFLKQHGICEWCGGAGRIVDHIVELTDENLNDLMIALDESNLQLLCLKCHNKKTFGIADEEIGEEYFFDDNGVLRTR